MRPISHPDTYVFLFDRHNWEGWKLGTKLPSFYSHHDGTCHFFEGVAVVDQMRKTKEGRIEVVVRDYADDKAAKKPVPQEHVVEKVKKALPVALTSRMSRRATDSSRSAQAGPFPFQRRIRKRFDGR